MPQPAARPPRRLGIATWIVGVSLLALLPMLGFSAYVVYREIADQQAQGIVALQRRAAIAAAAIGQELDSVFAEMNAMSQADGMRRGDQAAAHALALRVVASDPRLSSISITTADGERPWSTLQPYGTPLPRSNLAAIQRPVFEQGQRVVTPLVAGLIRSEPLLALVSPLDMGPGGRFALRAVVRPQALNARLNEQAWPPDWTAAVLDQNAVILARSRDAAQYVGQPATQTVQDGLQRGENLFRSVTKDGIAVISSIAAVPRSGWHVVVGRPVAALNAQVSQSMLAILVAGVVCALLAVGGALYLARFIGRQLEAVVHVHAQPLPATVPHTPIQEVAALSQALADARRRAESAAGELHDAREQVLAKLSERSEMLDVLAHEVRQPLNNASAALQAAAVVLKGGGQDSAAAPLQRAESVLNEVQASIDNTLAVAALLVGHGLAREDTDIDALIAVAVADLPAGDASRVRVERHTATRTASMDASLMRLALRNLLSNAMKCSPRGAPVVVRVADSDEPLALLIDVADAGPGIGPEMLERLFERGDRRPQAIGARRQGLGLYIVHRVMQLHGGEVQLVRNGPGGATMRLIIDQRGDD